MVSPEHFSIVGKGTEAIKEWRQANPEKILDLRREDLSLLFLENADLSGAQLGSADLKGTHLKGANLAGAFLGSANLYAADLRGANLHNAVLGMANLLRTRLREADLSGATLIWSDLAETDLEAANMVEADLIGATLRRCNLRHTNLERATIGVTGIEGCNLAEVKGLKTVRHGLPSSIGLDTIIRSFRGAGNRLTPELRAFFGDAGVPEEILRDIPRIISEIKYYSTFIAYGEPDAEFAKRLKKDLEGRGVSCWLYSTDHTVGDRTWPEIIENIRSAEKMIVLCSVNALIRDGFLKEIERQIDENPDKMVPVSLDSLWQNRDFLVQRVAGRDLKPFLLDKNYANFHSESMYKESLERLLTGLRLKLKPTS